MRDLVRRRLAAMPEETRQALLLAAAAPNPRLDRLASNGDATSIERDLAPAIAGGIVELDGDLVHFAHPLWAAAAYAAASAGGRRAAHRQLASGDCGTEERARHLALAAEGPDETVAAAMAAAAEQARARGASWPAAELAGHAARLSPGTRIRYDRAVTAAEYLFGAGDATGAKHALETLLGEAPDNTARARALLALGRVRMHELDFRAVRLILQQALGAPRTIACCTPRSRCSWLG
jgi:hypothetical protein